MSIPMTFDGLLLVDEQPGTIAERFVTFHETNPDVYAALVAHTRELVELGHQRVGIGMLWEVLRWSHMRTGDPTSDFKLNNDYRSHYARLIMDQEPDLADVFETRRLRAV